MQKYFEDIPAFVVYEMLYDMGFWDSQKIVKGLPWKDFIKRFENVTWAGDFFSVDVWTNCGLQTFYTEPDEKRLRRFRRKIIFLLNP